MSHPTTGEHVEQKYTKRDVLQALLDTGDLAGRLFDEVEADSFVITPDLLVRLANLVRRLDVMHQSFVAEYVLSGRAGDHIIDQMRASFGRRSNDGE